MNEMKDFHTQIQEFRQKAGMTQTELADKVGISRGAITAIEQGKRKVGVEELIKFCAAFNCSYQDLLPTNQPTRPGGKREKKNLLEMYDIYRKHYRRKKGSPPPERGNPIDNRLRRVNPYYQPVGDSRTIRYER